MGKRYQKNAEKWRAIKAKVAERDGKRKRRVIALRASKNKAKIAKAQAASSASKCKKLRKVNANIGKAYNKLKREMKMWRRKNSWLRKKKPRTARQMLGD